MLLLLIIVKKNNDYVLYILIEYMKLIKNKCIEITHLYYLSRVDKRVDIF